MARLFTLTSRVMGAAIGEALKEDEISQAEFARTVGVSPKHVNEVIRGKANARPAELDYWAWALCRTWVVSLERVEDEEDAP
jgi:transcriptional regulator with XRE-family HTH domain